MVTEHSPVVKPSSRSRPMKAPPVIQIRMSWCKGCGICVAYCKPEVIAMSDGLPHVVAAEKCTRCLQCEAICPDFAIEIQEPSAPMGEGSADS